MERNIRIIYFFMIFISLFLSAGGAYGSDDYRFEISGDYDSSETDDNVKREYWLFSGTFYVSPVSTGSYPLAEAAFFNQAGGVSLAAGTAEVDYGEDIKADASLLGIEAKYVFPVVPLSAGVSYNYQKYEFGSSYDGDVEIIEYGFNAGYFILDNLFLWFEYNITGQRGEITASGWTQKVEAESVDYSFSGKYVGQLDGGSAFNIGGSIGRETYRDTAGDEKLLKNDIIGISGDYYFTPEMSMGAEYSYNWGDDKDNEGNTFGFGFKKFFTSKFSVEVAFSRFRAENDEGEDGDDISIILTGRF